MISMENPESDQKTVHKAKYDGDILHWDKHPDCHKQLKDG